MVQSLHYFRPLAERIWHTTRSWTEAADLIVKGMLGAIQAKTVTYDFARLMDGHRSSPVAFGEAMIKQM